MHTVHHPRGTFIGVVLRLSKEVHVLWCGSLNRTLFPQIFHLHLQSSRVTLSSLESKERSDE